MNILLAYSSKTHNTKKVANAIYQHLKDTYTVDLLDIKKAKEKLPDYDLYLLGCWVDKATANKQMQHFIKQQALIHKKMAIFMTCGVPDNHPHAKESIDNFEKLLEKNHNQVLAKFICQGKIDPKIKIVFKFLSWHNPNFIHKMDNTMLEWIESSKQHPNQTDFQNVIKWTKTFLQ